jgi:hypothetical protein
MRRVYLVWLCVVALALCVAGASVHGDPDASDAHVDLEAEARHFTQEDLTQMLNALLNPEANGGGEQGAVEALAAVGVGEHTLPDGDTSDPAFTMPDISTQLEVLVRLTDALPQVSSCAALTSGLDSLLDFASHVDAAQAMVGLHTLEWVGQVLAGSVYAAQGIEDCSAGDKAHVAGLGLEVWGAASQNNAPVQVCVCVCVRVRVCIWRLVQVHCMTMCLCVCLCALIASLSGT